jgi:hypothetical protein
MRPPLSLGFMLDVPPAALPFSTVVLAGSSCNNAAGAKVNEVTSIPLETIYSGSGRN